MIDEELLHRVVDGEATPDERQRLEEALRLDPAARGRFEELTRLRDAIAAVPRLEPPAGLLQAVMAAVRATGRAPGPVTAIREGLRAAFARRPALSLGLAFATGLLVAAMAGGLAELGPWPRGGEASATMLSSGRLPGREIHRVTFGGPELRAEAVAWASADHVLVRIRLDGPGPVELAIGYAGGEEAALGFGRRAGKADTVQLGPEGLRVRGAGTGEYELVLPRPPLVDSVEIRLARGDDAYLASLRVSEDR